MGHVFTSSVGGGEGRGSDCAEDYLDLKGIYTDPILAKQFVEGTGIDCLAIAFGTVHGIYVKESQLDLERVKTIKKQVDIPLVMHGGSGVSPQDYASAINNGIAKINYYTYMNKAGGAALHDYVSRHHERPLFYDDRQWHEKYTQK